MSVTGKVRESKEGFSKETGFGEYKVICVNPDREALGKLLGNEVEKEIEYVSTDTDGVRKVNITFWLKNVKSNKLKSVRFFLKDSERENKDKTKKQYINAVGVSSWADDPANLPLWFTEKDYRVAHEGEEELYSFMRAWLGNLDLKDASTALSFDWDKLMKGNMRDISSLIGGEYEDTLVALSTVRVVEKDGDTKEYEQIYNRRFLPGYTMKFIRNKKDNNAFIEVAKATEKKRRTPLQNFILDVTDATHGIRDFYTLNELEEYDPTKNIVNTDKVLNSDDTDY